MPPLTQEQLKKRNAQQAASLSGVPLSITGFKNFGTSLAGGLKFPGVAPLSQPTQPTQPPSPLGVPTAGERVTGPVRPPAPIGVPTTGARVTGPIRPPQPTPISQVAPAAPTAVAPPIVSPQAAQAPVTPTPAAQPPTAPVTPPQAQFQPSPADAQLESLRSQVVSSFQPSKEEKTLTEEINRIITGGEQGLEAIRQQPISSTLLRGQQSALERQLNLQTAPLQRQLSILQQQREGVQEGTLAELGFKKEDIERISGEREAFEESQLPAPGEPGAQFTLSTGQVRFDAEGNVIARGPKKDGLARGVDGDISARAQEVLDNPALLDFFTPTEKGKIITELANQGVDLNDLTVNKISGSQREKIAEFDDLERQALEATILLETGLNTGILASRGQSIAAAFGQASPEFVNYRAAINNMSSTLLKMRSGAAVTPEEFERIKGFIPLINDDQVTAAEKINNFNREMGLSKANFIKRSTQTRFDIAKEVNKQNAGTFTTSGGNQVTVTEI